MLTCTRCKIEKPETSEFFPLHNKKGNGLDSWCRDCRNQYKRERNVPFGVNKSEYARAYEARETGECVICGEVENVVIDHDHATGQVRGPLCQHCNFGLGHFKDDPELLELAALYLRGQCACGNCQPKWGGKSSFVCNEVLQ